MTRKKKTKLEMKPGIAVRLLEVLETGAGRVASAAEAGITDDTIRHWEQRGFEAWTKRLRDETLNDRERTFADFYEQLRRAEAKPKTHMLGLIHKAAEGDWHAAAWLLEKLFPKEFGKAIDIRAKVEGEVTAKHDLSRLSLKQLKALKAIQQTLTEGNDDD